MEFTSDGLANAVEMQAFRGGQGIAGGHGLQQLIFCALQVVELVPSLSQIGVGHGIGRIDLDGAGEGFAGPMIGAVMEGLDALVIPRFGRSGRLAMAGLVPDPEGERGRRAQHGATRRKDGAAAGEAAFRRAQVGEQLVGRSIALAAVFSQQLEHDAVEVRGGFRIQLRRLGRLP